MGQVLAMVRSGQGTHVSLLCYLLYVSILKTFILKDFKRKKDIPASCKHTGASWKVHPP